ncbi:MAG TPA: glycosyltransferase family 4 protein [Terriglobales bacterium]|nr:glycosyltransferase family 4 protein [Terriglobales bacterium]
MRIGLIVPPFISVPPRGYGGTELFAAHLAEGLSQLGFDVVVYTNGESTVPVERRWIYPEGKWPLDGEIHSSLRDINHGAWAVRDAVESCDLIHLNNAPGIVHSRFSNVPFVYTIHHAREDGLSQFYSFYPDIWYVSISEFQKKLENVPKIRTIHHGLEVSQYRVGDGQRSYLTFLGRIAPMKGAHNAIKVAKRTGIPLKIAGEVQPMYQEYFEKEIKPHIDGKFIEFIGEADHDAKNELLGNSIGLLFPIEWDEPFGLVMIESMACGTPVFAFPGGSVAEVVQDGVSGYICTSVEHMAERIAKAGDFKPDLVRAYVNENFSIEKMVKSYADLYLEIGGVSPVLHSDLNEPNEQAVA